MDLGTQICEFLAKVARHKKSAYMEISDEEFGEMFEESIEFLHSCTDYIDHLSATPQDFVSLPNEIINDVVAIAAEDLELLEGDLESLAHINGPWSKFAQKIVREVNSIFIYRGGKFFRTLDYLKDEPFPVEEAQNHFISLCDIDERADFEQLRVIAPNLYERIQFRNVPNIPAMC